MDIYTLLSKFKQLLKLKSKLLIHFIGQIINFLISSLTRQIHYISRIDRFVPKIAGRSVYKMDPVDNLVASILVNMAEDYKFRLDPVKNFLLENIATSLCTILA